MYWSQTPSDITLLLREHTHSPQHQAHLCHYGSQPHHSPSHSPCPSFCFSCLSPFSLSHSCYHSLHFKQISKLNRNHSALSNMRHQTNFCLMQLQINLWVLMLNVFRFIHSQSVTHQHLPGGFLRMNVQSLCRVSSIPRFPHALQALPMVCFFALTCWKTNKTLKSVTLKKKKKTIVYQVLRTNANDLLWLKMWNYEPDL